jgi:hypothetical protein
VLQKVVPPFEVGTEGTPHSKLVGSLNLKIHIFTSISLATRDHTI